MPITTQLAQCKRPEVVPPWNGSCINWWPYQSRGIGAIETVHSYRRSNFLGGSSGVAARRNSGKRPLGSCSSDGAEGLSGKHGDVTGEVAVGRD